MSTVLNEIREAEKEAKKILEKAERDCGALIANAKKEALKLISDSQSSMDKDREKALSKKQKELETKREKILGEANEEAARIHKQAAKRIGKAVEYVLKQLEGEIVK